MKGYERTEGRRNGGITRLALVDADAVRLVAYDRSSGNAERIELVEGGSFALYHFREDSASLTEKTITESGFTKVVRELCFELEKLDRNQRESVEELIAKSPEGFVGVAYNGNGTAHLLGLSREMGNRFPLKVKSVVTSTGTSPADFSGDTVTLYNEDTAKAPLFTGELTITDNGKQHE